jgi:hypothetical protein
VPKNIAKHQKTNSATRHYHARARTNVLENYIINTPEITSPNSSDIPASTELAALLVVADGGEVVVVIDVLVGDVVVADRGNDSDTLGVSRLQNRCAKSSAVPSSLGHSPRMQFIINVGKFVLIAVKKVS